MQNKRLSVHAFVTASTRPRTGTRSSLCGRTRRPRREASRISSRSRACASAPARRGTHAATHRAASLAAHFLRRERPTIPSAERGVLEQRLQGAHLRGSRRKRSGRIPRRRNCNSTLQRRQTSCAFGVVGGEEHSRLLCEGCTPASDCHALSGDTGERIDGVTTTTPPAPMRASRGLSCASASLVLALRRHTPRRPPSRGKPPAASEASTTITATSVWPSGNGADGAAQLARNGAIQATIGRADVAAKLV